MKFNKKKIVAVAIIVATIMSSFSVYGNEFDYELGEPPIENKPTRASSTQIIEMDRTRTLDNIVNMAKMYPHTGFDENKETRYEVAPSFKSPYKAGSLNRDDIADALNALKMVRYLAGVPYSNAKFTDELNNISQHGAVLLAASSQFSHYPFKPVDMSESFFALAKRGAGEANITAGRKNISTQVLAYIADNGSNNIENAGHRRWILNPASENFGIGYARNTAPGDKYSGRRGSMHVFDNPSTEADTYVAWPNSGDFPIQYFSFSENINITPVYPWSINLGKDYLAPDRDKLNLKLTRERDGKVWNFNSSTYNITNGDEKYYDKSIMHLAVDNIGYGMKKAIVFRPDLNSLGALKDGDVFNVHLSGIQDKNGLPTVLEYSTRFFDLEKEMNRSTVYLTVTKDSIPISGATVVVGELVMLTDNNGQVTFRSDNNSTVTYAVSKENYGTRINSLTIGNSSENIKVELQDFKLGDVNGDTKISIADVSLTYQKYRNKLTVSSVTELAMDVNKDGNVSIADVSLIYNYYRGKISSFK